MLEHLHLDAPSCEINKVERVTDRSLLFIWPAGIGKQTEHRVKELANEIYNNFQNVLLVDIMRFRDDACIYCGQLGCVSITENSS
ncbi:hypothetical protein CEXT_769351 [Caerostris extrusa]|uniref:Uncharacterized protein n=1 Tax=Caerostris extrusa TaxID=172846 RepID=A0AAV4P494_CAEEX|nr:hypothetical protein CEXT_769351 [Caerostris extrusa]